MFSKVLKYDFRAIAKFFWILAISAIGTACVAGLFLNLSIDFLQDDDYYFIGTIAILLAVFAIIAFIGSIVTVLILLLVNFYKKLFSDEGYLTFTLPVSRKDILFSKTLNAFIWTLLSVALLFVGVAIILLFFPETTENIFGGFWDNAWDSVGAWSIVYSFEILLAILSVIAFSVVLVEFSVTVGATLAKRARLFVGIAIWYGTNAVLSLVTQFVGLFGTLVIDEVLDKVSASLGSSGVNAVIALIALIVIFIVASLTYVLYCITLSMLERKLNLV